MRRNISETDLLTPVEAGIVAGVPLKAVYKAMRERLPRRTVVMRKGRPFLTKPGVVCIRLDRELPKDVPIRVRRAVYEGIGEKDRRLPVTWATGPLSYVVDFAPAARAVAAALARYRKAMALVVEDPEIQGGAAVFKGTRVLVRPIADLLAAGVPEKELLEDYPRLTREMLAAATIFAKAHPRRGRPRVPGWRRQPPLVERIVARHGA